MDGYKCLNSGVLPVTSDISSCVVGGSVSYESFVSQGVSPVKAIEYLTLLNNPAYGSGRYSQKRGCF